MSGYCDKFERRVRAYIGEHRLLHAGAPVVVALSGGADSVALLAALHRSGYDCRAAHCNYHLRGDESQRDMRHAQAVCATLGVDLYIRDFDVEAYRLLHGGSVEMACRDLRYQWFADLLDRDGAQGVAVGHHSEDRVETFMLNLMRGTGIAGLTSMRPRNGHVVRPLLGMCRHEIERYVAECGLTFITDSSNASDAHRRNRLRNTVLPGMEDAFPGAADAILRTIANLEGVAAVYREAIGHKTERYRHGATIDLAAVAKEEAAHTVLYEMLSPLGFSAAQVADMLAAPMASGLRYIAQGGDVVAEQARGTIELTDAKRIDAMLGAGVHAVDLRHDVVCPVRIDVSAMPVENFHAERLGPAVAYIDAAALDGAPLWELRHPRRGDRLVPFGATKSKLLSDIFAAAKFTAAQKRSQWVLTRDGEIVWLPGLRNSALWCVGPDTKRYIRLFFNESNNT